jgi:hypothetical protein
MTRPYCEGCNHEYDPDMCWCGDDIKDHRGLSHNHTPVPMGCVCNYETRKPREMVLDDICPRVIDLGNGDTFVRRMPDADYERAFK